MVPCEVEHIIHRYALVLWYRDMLDILALDLEPVAALDISQMPDGNGIKGTQVDTACMAQEMIDL